jgi:hypothetical protein
MSKEDILKSIDKNLIKWHKDWGSHHNAYNREIEIDAAKSIYTSLVDISDSDAFIFPDISGSTSMDNYSNYKDLLWWLYYVVVKFRELLPNKTEYFPWNFACKKLSKEDLISRIFSRKGYDGTDPMGIADILIQSKWYGVVIILTDGQVGNVSKVRDKMEHFHSNSSKWFSKVINIMIQTDAPIEETFTSCIYLGKCFLVNHTISKDGKSSNVEYVDHNTLRNNNTLIDAIRAINTWSEFNEQSEKLLIEFRALLQGKNGNEELKVAILSLNKRLNTQVSNQVKEKIGHSSDIIFAPNVVLLQSFLINHKEREALITAAQLCKIEQTIKQEIKIDDSPAVGSILSKLIQLANGNNKINWNDLTKRSPQQQQQNIIPEPDENAPECPIMCEEAVLGLSIYKCEPFSLEELVKLGKNPLSISEEQMGVLASCFGPAISLKVFDELSKRSFGLEILHPETRIPMTSCPIPFVNGTNVWDHFKYSLSKFLTGNKKILCGRPIEWLVIFIQFIEHPKYCNFLKQYIPDMYDFLRIQINIRPCPMSLSNLPDFPNTKVPLPVAAWIILNWKNLGIQENLHKYHKNSLLKLIWIVEFAGYTLDPEFKEYIQLIALLNVLRKWLDRDRKVFDILVDPYKPLLTDVKEALRHPYIEIPPGTHPDGTKYPLTLITRDGEINNKQLVRTLSFLPENVRHLPLVKLYYIIEYAIDELHDAYRQYPNETYLKNFKLEPINNVWDKVDGKIFITTLCDKTCRPYSDWKEPAKIFYGKHFCSSKKLFSTCQNVSKVIKASDTKYPNKDQILVRLHRKFPILPARINDYLNAMLQSLNPIKEKISVQDFVIKFKKSASLITRQKMEKMSDDEYLNFMMPSLEKVGPILIQDFDLEKMC